MRRLNGHDVFAALNAVKCAGVQNELQRIALEVQKTKKEDLNVERIGAELIFSILGNCGTAESEEAILSFLSGPLETTVNELKNADALELIERIKALGEVIGKEEWSGFFKSLSGLIR